MKFRKFYVSLLVVLLTFTALSESASGYDEDVEQMLFHAYEAISVAESAVGNVSSMVSDLNLAIELLEKADATSNPSLVDDALLLIDQILEVAPQVVEAGAAARQTRNFTVAASLMILMLAAFMVYRYLPAVFWRLWIRSKREWKVKA